MFSCDSGVHNCRPVAHSLASNDVIGQYAVKKVRGSLTAATANILSRKKSAEQLRMASKAFRLRDSGRIELPTFSSTYQSRNVWVAVCVLRISTPLLQPTE